MPNDLETIAGAMYRAGLVLFGMPLAIWTLYILHGTGTELYRQRRRPDEPHA